MAQQPVSVMVYGGNQPAVIQAAPSTVVPVPVRRQTLPHRESHKRLGIIQMTVGSLCFVLSIIGFFVSNPFYSYFGAGIYSGIFFIIPGLLGFLAYQHNSKCLVVSCMVMNIIASCVSVIGLSFASIELSVNYNYSGFQKAKCGIIIGCCVFELVTSIVHAAFTCASCCDCCLPKEAVAVPSQVAGPVVIQQVPATNISYPTQAYQFQGYMPQHQAIVTQQQQVPAYPQQFTHNYPQQPFIQAVGPQNVGDNPPPYNPSHIDGSAPPPYSTNDFPTTK